MNSQQLPPGQIATRKFPVVGEKAPPEQALDLERWRLRVEGLVHQPLELSWSELKALGSRERRVDIHCVTGWSHFGTTFHGLPLRELLERSGIDASARFVRFEAYSARGHDTSLPLDLALDDTWLVHSREGEPLEPEHGFPLRTLTPSRYFYKSLKWLHRIQLIAEDRLGYWERESSYHNVGNPWPGDQRFTTGSVDPAQMVRFRTASSFDRWRNPKKVLLGLDLRSWSPVDRDLSRLQLKNCNLDGADLRGVDLRGANLSLTSLRGADLQGADARGADLEGADFAGADLRNADFGGTALSATRFFDADDPESTMAKVSGLKLEGATGILGSQEEAVRRAAESDSET